MALEDPYNYKTLVKGDSMYLSTIKNEDCRLRKFKQMESNRDYSYNLFNLDIPGIE